VGGKEGGACVCSVCAVVDRAGIIIVICCLSVPRAAPPYRVSRPEAVQRGTFDQQLNLSTGVSWPEMQRPAARKLHHRAKQGMPLPRR